MPLPCANCLSRSSKPFRTQGNPNFSPWNLPRWPEKRAGGSRTVDGNSSRDHSRRLAMRCCPFANTYSVQRQKRLDFAQKRPICANNVRYVSKRVGWFALVNHHDLRRCPPELQTDLPFHRHLTPESFPPRCRTLSPSLLPDPSYAPLIGPYPLRFVALRGSVVTASFGFIRYRHRGGRSASRMPGKIPFHPFTLKAHESFLVTRSNRRPVGVPAYTRGVPSAGTALAGDGFARNRRRARHNHPHRAAPPRTPRRKVGFERPGARRPPAARPYPRRAAAAPRGRLDRIEKIGDLRTKIGRPPYKNTHTSLFTRIKTAFTFALVKATAEPVVGCGGWAVAEKPLRE